MESASREKKAENENLSRNKKDVFPSASGLFVFDPTYTKGVLSFRKRLLEHTSWIRYCVWYLVWILAFLIYCDGIVLY